MHVHVASTIQRVFPHRESVPYPVQRVIMPTLPLVVAIFTICISAINAQDNSRPENGAALEGPEIAQVQEGINQMKKSD